MDFDFVGVGPVARAAAMPGLDFVVAALVGAALADAALPAAGFVDLSSTLALPGRALAAPVGLDFLAGLDFLDDAIREVWWLARK